MAGGAIEEAPRRPIRRGELVLVAAGGEVRDHSLEIVSTPLPARRTFTLNAPAKDGEVLLSFAEGSNDIKVDLIQPEADEDEDEEEEPLEPEEVKTPRIKADKERKAEISIKSKKDGKITVQVIVLENGKTTIEVGNDDGEKQQVELPASA